MECGNVHEGCCRGRPVGSPPTKDDDAKHPDRLQFPPSSSILTGRSLKYNLKALRRYGTLTRKELFMRKCFAVLLMAAVWGMSAVAQDTRAVTVFAAASLTDAFNAIAADFEAQNPNVEIVFSFGGSSQLATQILEGAPVDVFASANLRQMQTLVDAQAVADTPRVFARNRLVLIVPAENPANLRYLRDLANDGVKLVLAAPAVPVREYTDAMLDKMAASRLYGAAYRDAVLANLVSEEDNVRQVAAKVALGEADAGIVYLSDVTPDLQDDVQMIPIPDRLNTLAEYPIAALSDSALAAAFVDYVLSDTGQAVLESWNLVPVR